MDWMHGKHLSEFAKTDFKPKLGNKLEQILWDFYMFQIHGLRKVHADPHPGNFLISDRETLIAIDFGCVKEVPDEFYILILNYPRKRILPMTPFSPRNYSNWKS